MVDVHDASGATPTSPSWLPFSGAEAVGAERPFGFAAPTIPADATDAMRLEHPSDNASTSGDSVLSTTNAPRPTSLTAPSDARPLASVLPDSATVARDPRVPFTQFMAPVTSAQRDPRDPFATASSAWSFADPGAWSGESTDSPVDSAAALSFPPPAPSAQPLDFPPPATLPISDESLHQLLGDRRSLVRTFPVFSTLFLLIGAALFIHLYGYDLSHWSWLPFTVAFLALPRPTPDNRALNDPRVRPRDAHGRFLPVPPPQPPRTYLLAVFAFTFVFVLCGIVGGYLFFIADRSFFAYYIVFNNILPFSCLILAIIVPVIYLRPQARR